MPRYVDCIAHNASDARLLIGEKSTVLFDCGMAFCAEKTIELVKDALQGRELDYIFITHTHYDHIGALPFFRKEWPQLRLGTSQTGADVLRRETPRRVIRQFSQAAADRYGVPCDLQYDDDLFRADFILKDQEVFPLGGVSVETLETPGHTRDSLSYFVPELKLLLLCETPGVLLPDGNLYVCHLSSYADTVHSIERCRHMGYEQLSLPHRGIATTEEMDGFFDRALETNASCRAFIIHMLEDGLNEREMLSLFFREYGSTTLSDFQPQEAFDANALAMFSCAIRECTQ